MSFDKTAKDSTPSATAPRLPAHLYVREQRDFGDMDCEDFTTKPLRAGQFSECDGDGHYRCAECSNRNPDTYVEFSSGYVQSRKQGWVESDV